MKDEATPEQLALARRVYAQFIIDNVPGAGPDDVPVFDDSAHGVRIALRAIQETTELAYRLAADHADQCDDTAAGRARNATARDIYEALRDGEHLKGHPHE